MKSRSQEKITGQDGPHFPTPPFGGGPCTVLVQDIVKIFMKKRRTFGTTEVAEKYSVSSKR
jgi:hypothetical protein